MNDKIFNDLLNLANKTTKTSKFYGCNLILNQLYPEDKDKWIKAKNDWLKDTSQKLPYPLEGEFFNLFKKYIVLKLCKKLGYDYIATPNL